MLPPLKRPTMNHADQVAMREVLRKCLLKLLHGHVPVDAINQAVHVAESVFVPVRDPFWSAHCKQCGWTGNSSYCGGGQPLPEPGDVAEVSCPVCHSTDLEARGLHVHEFEADPNCTLCDGTGELTPSFRCACTRRGHFDLSDPGSANLTPGTTGV